MIDGIVIPGLNGWAIKGADGSTNSQTALLTLTNPLAAVPHNWMVTMYQIYEGAPGAFQSGFFLGDFSLAYTTLRHRSFQALRHRLLLPVRPL
jgi:hypothetical protein